MHAHYLENRIQSSHAHTIRTTSFTAGVPPVGTASCQSGKDNKLVIARYIAIVYGRVTKEYGASAQG